MKLLILSYVLLSAGLLHANPYATLNDESVKPCAVPCERTAVIFVHGITGDRTTWLNPETKAYMPGMLAAETVIYQGADIYRVDYEGTWSTGPAIGKIAKEMNLLLDKKIWSKQYSKVIFIAHSLGGNLVRSYILHVKTKWGHEALSRIRLVVSLGTPYEGSSLANIARFFSSNEQIRILRPIDINDYQTLLNDTIEDLKDKHIGCNSLFTFTGYETLPEPKIGKIVVDPHSATLAAASANDTRDFVKSHSGLSKPFDQKDKVYRWTSDLVIRCMQDDGSVCPVNKAPHCKTGDFDAKRMDLP